MSESTTIGWTDATFNPWWGCVEVSRECDNCYARVWARRTGKQVWGKHSPRRAASEAYWRLPFTKLRAKADELGRPCRVFCASMADVFETHPDLPPLRERLWDVIERTPWIDWQLLTKRPRSVQLMAPWGDDWPANVWIGTSIGAPEHTWRADVLREIPAAVRFISAEPLLGDLFSGKRPLSLAGVHWLIVGGESGGKARPFALEHCRALMAAARAERTATFIKQLGAKPVEWVYERYASDAAIQAADAPRVPVDTPLKLRHPKGEDMDEWPDDLRVRDFPLAGVPA